MPGEGRSDVDQDPEDETADEVQVASVKVKPERGYPKSPWVTILKWSNNFDDLG